MKRILTIFLVCCLCMTFMCSETGMAAEENKCYLGKLVSTNSEYAEGEKIESDDIHFGWELGRFYITGYTRETADEDDNLVFLKNVGDKVKLWFNLEQDINKLNGKDSLSISNDDDGIDENFGVEKSDFGKGTLIIKQTTYQKEEKEPVIYTDYLSANLKKGADTEVELFEEGDYEVALDYEIKDDPRKILGVSVFPSYENYRISFKFSVRNGNCMVFPFDVKTGEELTNTSVTENGFRLDLAKSRYLDIDITKKVLNEGKDGLSEDTRFNRPAKDGEEYVEEGIYTIVVKNRYTGQSTEKVIYVGDNDVLKAHVTTGYSIKKINAELAEGAVVDENGKLQSGSSNMGSGQNEDENMNSILRILKKHKKNILFAIGVLLVLVVMVGIAKKCKKRKKNKHHNKQSDSWIERTVKEMEKEESGK